MLIIGLTGGIGAGKTAVCGILRELGAEVISADEAGHKAYARGTEAWREVVEEFGQGVLSPGGEIDRRALGAIVFKYERALKRLNAIVHPRARSIVRERIDEFVERAVEVVVVEAPLLLEADWTPLVDEVWVISAPEDQVVRRTESRSGLDADSIRARISSQIPEEARLRHADAIIENDGSLAQLRERVRALWVQRTGRRKECEFHE